MHLNFTEIYILAIGIFLSSVFAIYFKVKEKKSLYGWFKPLTTILIIGLAIWINYLNYTTYNIFIILGLFFGLVGDIYLLKDARFVKGLVAFLIAHLFFIGAFIAVNGFVFNIIPLLYLTVFAVIYFSYLRSKLGNYLVPVIVYISIIVVMCWQALSLVSEYSKASYIIAGSAILFAFSDSVLAYNKFIKASKYYQILVLVSYWGALVGLSFAGIYV